MRYFFDVTDRNGTSRDADGIVLADLDQMRREARRTLAEIAADEPYPADELKLGIAVRDERGREIYNICLRIEEHGSQPSESAA